MTKKQEVRKQALMTRDALSAEFREVQSAKIVERILQDDRYRKAKIILSYVAFRSEVETEELNRQVLVDGKQLYLPKTYVDKKEMRFFQVKDLTKLEAGYQGIREPQETEELTLLFESSNMEKEDVFMIMPGVAFDEAGNRMGYGGGYYDRYLTQYGSRMISALLAFEEQKVEEIPTESCDVQPEIIVTQERMYR